MSEQVVTEQVLDVAAVNGNEVEILWNDGHSGFYTITRDGDSDGYRTSDGKFFTRFSVKKARHAGVGWRV